MLVVFLDRGRVSVRSRPLPRRPAGFALIRLRLAGICNTDLELQRGYYGFRGTPGHEFVGDVVESDDPSLTGRRVTGEINLACGSCDWCARGLGRHCPKRSVLGIVRHPGAFQEYFTLPERNLRPIPSAVPDAHAVFTEPLAAACEILDQVRIPRGATVAVLGDGKLGLLISQVLHAHGADVLQFGRHRRKLEIAEGAGIRTRLAGKRAPRAAFDWVVEATGSSAGLEQAIHMTRPRGTIILKSTVHDKVAIDSAPVIVNEVSLIGSRCGRFEPALRLLRQRRIQLDPMISGRLPVREAPRAFELAAEKGALKFLLEP